MPVRVLTWLDSLAIEVDELGLTLRGHEDVVRADVAVDHVQRLTVRSCERMRMMERSGDVAAHLEQDLKGHGFVAGQRCAGEAAQVAAVEVLHREVPDVPRLTESLHAHGVWVVEPSRQARLILEHRDEVVVISQVGEDALDHELS